MTKQSRLSVSEICKATFLDGRLYFPPHFPFVLFSPSSPLPLLDFERATFFLFVILSFFLDISPRMAHGAFSSEFAALERSRWIGRQFADLLPYPLISFRNASETSGAAGMGATICPRNNTNYFAIAIQQWAA